MTRSGRCSRNKTVANPLEKELSSNLFDQVFESHWSLLILCGFGEESRCSCPCLIVLDSLQNAGHTHTKEIRELVMDLHIKFGKTISKDYVDDLPLLIPKVPQQKGAVECGWYALLFAKLFIENAPKVFSIEDGYPYFMDENWFTIDHFLAFQKMMCEDQFTEVIEKEVDASQLTDNASQFEPVCGSRIAEFGNTGLTEGEESGEESSNSEAFSDSEYSHSDDEDFLEQIVDEGMDGFDKSLSVEVRKANMMDIEMDNATNMDDLEAEMQQGVDEQHDTPMHKGKTPIVKSQKVDNGTEQPEEGKKNKRGGKRGRRLGWHMAVNTGSVVSSEGIGLGADDQSDSEDEDEAYYQSNSSSDEEIEKEKKARNYPRFERTKDMEDPIFKVGMLFNSKMDLMAAVRSHGVCKGREVKFAKNAKDKVRAICKGNNCTWQIYAHRVEDTSTFQVRTLQDRHSCVRSLNHKLATARYLSAKFIDVFKSDQGVNVTEFREKIHRELNVNITPNVVYKTKALAKTLIEGDYKGQYKLIWDYLEELRRSNPGTTVYLDTVEDEETGKEIFNRIYVSLAALRRGFLAGCRKLIGLDGTFLKGPHPGVLLTAVALDANNGIYPVVYAVVESENKASWRWFLQGLIQDLHIVKEEDWSFISDRQKGLLPALGGLLPGSEHRHCVRHLHNNFKKYHTGDALKTMMWQCAKATYVNRFETDLEALRRFDEKAFEWLKKNTHPRHWSRSHFTEVVKCDTLLNNHCEAFNKNILTARTKPLLEMLERIRTYLMLRCQSKREWIERQQGRICPRIQKRLEKLKDLSANCFPSFAGGAKFEVKERSGEQFAVDISLKNCTCRAWQLTGIPCVHGIAALGLGGEIPEDFVDNCYSIKSYKKAYEYIIGPTNGPNNWPKSTRQPVLPPKKINLPGRPKVKRRPELGEKGCKVYEDGTKKLSKVGFNVGKCGRCRQRGHNVRMCPVQPSNVQDNGPAPAQEIGEGSHTLGHNLNMCGACGELGHNKRTCKGPKTCQNPESIQQEEINQQEMQTILGQDPPANTQQSSITNSLMNENCDGAIDNNEAVQPKKKQRRPFRCSWCGNTGHIRATCREPGSYLHPKITKAQVFEKYD